MDSSLGYTMLSGLLYYCSPRLMNEYALRCTVYGIPEFTIQRRFAIESTSIVVALIY